MSINAVILGGAGYVGGELLRLIQSHPEFELAAAISRSHANEPIGKVFPHLAQVCRDIDFVAPDDWAVSIAEGSDVALFSAAPHGASAAFVSAALAVAAGKNFNVHVVDSSADFRYDDPLDFAAVYGMDHAAPEILDLFTCAVPEHTANMNTPHAGHPGCFATAALLAAVPLVQAGLVAGDLYLSGITGSTGSGRSVKPGTHHPERHGNLYAYKPLTHRHSPEIGNLIGKACGSAPNVHFVPHSGPFARGIHMTLQAPLQDSATTEAVFDIFARYYAESLFVDVIEGAPRLKSVVTSNQSHIGVSTDERSVTVMCVIDNLMKGAAGGAMQWMNRLWSFPEQTGLSAAPAPWI